MGTVLVDQVSDCATRMAELLSCGEPVAVDYEGVNLCRSGVLCIVQIAPKRGAVLLIDIETMGNAAFDEGHLRQLLESQSLMKLCYDCRADADALYHLHGVTPANLFDLQVAYCTKRDVESVRGRDPYLKGLGTALQGLGLGSAQSRELEQVKNNGLALFAPEKGGSYEVWRQRPLPQALIDYASLDVAYLHIMFEKWARFVPVDQMRELTAARVKRAVDGRIAAKGQHMARKDF